MFNLLMLANAINLILSDSDHESCNLDEDVQRRYIEIDDVQRQDLKRPQSWGYCNEENMYICSDGKKIDCNLRCDGKNDCGQFSDEGIFADCWFGEILKCFECEIIGETTKDVNNCRKPKSSGLTRVDYKSLFCVSILGGIQFRSNLHLDEKMV
ncbi:DgyrCDS6293 [Dimorphilus gyrociliatus]|uniref:DgyrCDS6293 n=1 Tax=Dimorphilus gyrociliatus TaxID=2664684 RepID=A0A7I8VMM8_9ANNE|nr:DgyrCDS6293 [Dimorphilus gyrociliatus]